MTYYSGSANSYAELLIKIQTACTDMGWTLSGNILSKGKAFVKIYVSNTDQNTANAIGSGIVLQGGTGQAAGNLINPSTAQPRLGRPGIHSNFEPVTWPVDYNIHIFNNPDEVYVVINFKNQFYYWLSFGVSSVSGLTGTGLWLSATSRMNSQSGGPSGFSMTPTSGRGGGNSYYLECSGLFWGDYKDTDPVFNCETVHSDFDGLGWQGNAYNLNESACHAIVAAAPHIELSPNAWNQDAPLIPIHAFVWRKESKCSLAVMPNNARYIRIDNHDPGDIITLGVDKWRVYPFHQKNTAARDGGSTLNHTGTFGFAVRYDG